MDTTLVNALARAFRWRRMIETGRHATVAELAAAKKINPSYVSRVLRLTLLAPEMVEAILDGRRPKGVTLPCCWSIRDGQATRVCHFLSFLISALARMMSFRMTAVMACFGAFPALMSCSYFVLRSALKRMATRAGM